MTVVERHGQIAAPTRRRRTLPAIPPLAVAPVPGTDAAVRAETVAAANASRAAQHILRQADTVLPPKGAARGLPKGMTPGEAADRIVAALLAGTGPILLLVPGTLGTEYQTSMLSLGRAALRRAGAAPLCVASIPYANGIADIVTRFLHVGTKPDANVLSLVLRRLRQFAPHRAIYLAGESQGAWLIADTLRIEPGLAGGVTRIAMFAKPGFVASPTGVGAATDAADGARGIVEWRHDDDIVPNLFGGVGSAVIGALVRSLGGLASSGAFHYTPHHYDRYGATAARWLLDGIRPPRTSLLSTAPLPADEVADVVATAVTPPAA